MAAAGSNIKLSIVCFLLIICVNFSSSGEYSGLLSRLYKKAAQNNRPLILVLDNSNHGKLKDVSKMKSYQSSDENEDSVNPLTYLFQMAQTQKKTSLMKRPSKQKHTHVHEIKDLNKPKLRSRDRRQRLRSRDSNDRRDERDRRENRILRSPVMKSLLRMANGLSCQARNECEDQCNGKFGDSKKNDACEDKCEEKFECEEEEKDECEETEDECGEETTTDCNVSTRGERLVEEGNNECKRC